MKSLWGLEAAGDWRAALAEYEQVIARQAVERLPELDRWYREELPKSISARRNPHVTVAELTRITEWKMKRGVWRARNLALVKGNSPEDVEEISASALAAAPHPTKPITTLSELAGVGPATASAVVAAASPRHYPFFDELVAAQVPGLGEFVFTLGYYTRYSAALRERAERLGADWNPALVERALWANSGGKIAL